MLTPDPILRSAFFPHISIWQKPREETEQPPVCFAPKASRYWALPSIGGPLEEEDVQKMTRGVRRVESLCEKRRAQQETLISEYMRRIDVCTKEIQSITATNQDEKREFLEALKEISFSLGSILSLNRMTRPLSVELLENETGSSPDWRENISVEHQIHSLFLRVEQEERAVRIWSYFQRVSSLCGSVIPRAFCEAGPWIVFFSKMAQKGFSISKEEPSRMKDMFYAAVEWNQICLYVEAARVGFDIRKVGDESFKVRFVELDIENRLSELLNKAFRDIQSEFVSVFETSFEKPETSFHSEWIRMLQDLDGGSSNLSCSGGERNKIVLREVHEEVACMNKALFAQVVQNPH